MNPIKIVGGGLSGCLLMAALKHKWPELEVTLCERSSSLSDHQTWSFHAGDVPPSCWAWLAPLVSKSWAGYDVHFPCYSRSFTTGYHSIRSQDLVEKIKTNFSKNISFQTEVQKSDPNFGDYFITAGWNALENPKNFGFQKFVGLDLKLKKPHGLTKPILKDVREPQTDGYRFFYILPFSETELMIEDTYYSNNSKLDTEFIKKGILEYAEKNKWDVENVLRQESGSLPLDLYTPKPQHSLPLALGAAANLAHPVTGYTFPSIIRQIQCVIESDQADIELWKKRLDIENKKIRSSFGFYCFLNRMMFGAATAEKRYIILQRFYTLSDGLIERFYGGRTRFSDQIRILMGKPPVPILSALKQIPSGPKPSH